MGRRESSEKKRRRVQLLMKRLRKEYPGATTALRYESPLELLIATILSAQCTDERVNRVTPALFARYERAKDYQEADRTELEELIRPTGFYRNKAKSIQGAAAKIASDYGSEVPRTMEELLTLPGVARKTANVVLGTAFGIAEGIVVDTHVFRLAHRMGLVSGKTPAEVERELMAIVPKKDWIDFGHMLIHHGRAICTARSPACERCVVAEYCPKVGVDLPKARPTKKSSSTKAPALRERILAARKK